MPGASEGGDNGTNQRVPDSSEQIIISSLALLKMLKHGRAGVPMEVMGLMLGSFVDEYTTRVVDVFAMPQAGTSVTVEAVDPVFQARMLEMIKQTDRPENVVGWYHSHPGFGCWLSGIDLMTHQAFEKLDSRNVAVVVDPIQSVKGKVVLDAFRSVDPQKMMMDSEFQQHTSNMGTLKRPTLQALYNGLNKSYFSLVIGYNKQSTEQKMLMHLYKNKWTKDFKVPTFSETKDKNKKSLESLKNLTKGYSEWVKAEGKQTQKEFAVASVGKINPKRHLRQTVEELRHNSVLSTTTLSLATKAF